MASKSIDVNRLKIGDKIRVVEFLDQNNPEAWCRYIIGQTAEIISIEKCEGDLSDCNNLCVHGEFAIRVRFDEEVRELPRSDEINKEWGLPMCWHKFEMIDEGG